VPGGAEKQRKEVDSTSKQAAETSQGAAKEKRRSASASEQAVRGSRGVVKGGKRVESKSKEVAGGLKGAGKEKKRSGPASATAAAVLKGDSLEKKVYKQPTLQFYKGPDASDDVVIRKSGKSKFVEIGKQFVQSGVQAEDAEEEVPVDFQRDSGEVDVYQEQFEIGVQPSANAELQDDGRSGRSGQDSRSEKVVQNNSTWKGEEEERSGKTGRDNRGGGVGAVVGGGESVYERVIAHPVYANVMKAGRRWLYAVHAHSAAESERAKGVRDL
jgi:hypothetical protein